MSYLKKRGNFFYYLEVWDKQILRDNKISSVLDESTHQTFFVNGSLKSLNKVDKIELAHFWKNKSSAENRILSLKRNRPKDEYVYLLKSLTREEFIDIIPDECSDNIIKYKKVYWEINKQLKDKEKNYKRKLENPWREFKTIDLTDVLSDKKV
jgi:hypothetical protein